MHRPFTRLRLRVHDDILVAIMRNSSVLALCNWRRTNRSYYVVVATILRARARIAQEQTQSSKVQQDPVLLDCWMQVKAHAEAFLDAYLVDSPKGFARVADKYKVNLTTQVKLF